MRTPQTETMPDHTTRNTCAITLIEPQTFGADRPSQIAPVLVAFSGGMDSTVLLHLLANHPRWRQRGLRALHVHHGLHANADAWAEHCRRVCDTLDVPLSVIETTVDRTQGDGLEAAARRARRDAFAAGLSEGLLLALAHHRDDQAETVLLRLLRASGTDGLAAMRGLGRFDKGWMWRPLLHTSRAQVRAYAQDHSLSWIEDPSNADTDHDRNYLRHRVLPLLRARWPQADDGFARSAMLAAESSDLLTEQDRWALEDVREEVGDGLSIAALRALSPARRARVLRLWVSQHKWPPLPFEGIAQIERVLLDDPAVRDDGRTPGFAWQGVEIRRWREGLHAITTKHDLPADWSQPWDGAMPCLLPNNDVLILEGAAALPAPVRVHARSGGERIRLPGREHRHRLKHVLQDAGHPPWERQRMPLISRADGVLLAAGDHIRSAEFEQWLSAHAAQLVWKRS